MLNSIQELFGTKPPSKLAIQRLSEEQAYCLFGLLLYPENDGRPPCPKCSCAISYSYKCRPIFKCKACHTQFSLTSNTPFAYKKISYANLMGLIAEFLCEAQGASANAASNGFGLAYRSVWSLFQKMRATMVKILDAKTLSGTVEVDGTYIGGYIRPKNVKKIKEDHRKFPYRDSRKGASITAVIARNGSVRTTVTRHESESIPFILGCVEPGTILHADSANCWNILEAHYKTFRINHKQQYWSEESSTNTVEIFFSFLKNSARGTYRRIIGPYLLRYANEYAWRHTYRRSNYLQRMQIIFGALLHKMKI